jgi:hypothetical protein
MLAQRRDARHFRKIISNGSEAAMHALPLSLMAAAAASLAQPAQAPTSFQLVTKDGSRQEFATSYVERISLLPGSFEADRIALERARLRMLCISRCPATLPSRWPAQDTIYWKDGRQTIGHVSIYRRAIGQDGLRVGRLLDVERIELGTGRTNPRLRTGIRPGLVSISGGSLNRPNPATGDYVVFREPWVTLTERTLTLQGQEPVPRGEIRFISHSGSYGGHFADPTVAEDVVIWSDGSRTAGRVLISNGQVEQPRRPRRPFREARYIELAPAR